MMVAMPSSGSQTMRIPIPHQTLNRIFDSFYTTKATGMGMGLPICRRIIDSYNGTIEAEWVHGLTRNSRSCCHIELTRGSDAVIATYTWSMMTVLFWIP
jgi:light-regulated signal transduction histidine kinase (bacteriophytochrome)